MAKKKLNEQSLIYVELKHLEEKVSELQKYLQINPIVTKVTNGNQILLSEDDQSALHKEILIQIKMQDSLFNWLPLLEKLKEKKEEQNSIRGDAEIGGMFKE